MRRMKYILFLLILLCPFYNVFAEEQTITISSVVLADKTENTLENDSPIIDDTQINYDLIFHDTGDSVTYNIKIKNNSDTHYIINQIFDNNSNEAIQYEYTILDNDFNKGDKQTIQMKVIYKDEIPSDSVLEDSLYHLDDNLTISFDLIEYNLYYILNPRTNSNIIFFYILFIVLLVFIFKRKRKYVIPFVLLFIIFSFYNVMAKDMETVELSLNIKVEIPINIIDSGWRNKVTGNYTKFVISKDLSIPNDSIDISEKQDGSIKGWIDNDTLYFGSKYRMYLPSSCDSFFNKVRDITSLEFGKDSISSKFTKNFSYMFSYLSQIEKLDTSWINTDNATNLYYMFGNCSKLKKLDLSGFYNPGITNINSDLIYYCNSLEELDLSNWRNSPNITSIRFQYLPSTIKKLNLDNFDTSHLTSMYYMFSYNQLSDVEIDLSTWDFSNVADMGYMFYNSKYKKVLFNGGEFTRLNYINYMFYQASIENVYFEANTCPSLTSVRYMFYYATDIGSLDLSGWDFSHATDFYDIFYYGKFGSIEFGNIDTSSATYMAYAFAGVKSLKKLDLRNWDFDYVTSLYYMFAESELEEILIGNINSDVLNDISSMFFNTKHLKIVEWDNFNITSTTSIYGMFYNSTVEKLDLSSFDLSSITYSTNFLTNTLNLEEIITPKAFFTDTSQEIFLPYGFIDSNSNEYYSLDYNSPTNVKLTKNDTYSLLVSGQNFALKIKKLAGTSSPSYSTSNTNIERIEISNSAPDLSQMTDDNIVSVYQNHPVYAWFDNGTIYLYSEDDTIYANVDSSYMFTYLHNLEYVDFSNINTSKVKNMSYMFYYTGSALSNVSFDVSLLDTSNVSNMADMFYYFGYNATTFSLVGFPSWDTSNVSNMSSMFYNAGYSATSFQIDLSHFNTSNVIYMSNMFSYAGYRATTWSIGDLSNWNTSELKGMSSMFSSAGYNATNFELDLSSFDTSHVTSMYYLFYYAGYNSNLFVIRGLSGWDVSKVTSMSFVFSNAGSNATTWSIGDLSNWNTSKVTNMEAMFQSSINSKLNQMTTSWSVGDLSNWDVSNVTTMDYMFAGSGYSSETFDIGDLSNWDVSKVTNMEAMFSCAGLASSSINLGNLSNWNVANNKNFKRLFQNLGANATSWYIGNLSSWNTANATNMNAMFSTAGKFATNVNIGNLSNWSTSKVTDMSYMFNAFATETQAWNVGDLSNWNVSNVTNMDHMFNRAAFSATSFNIGDLSNWDTSKVTNMDYMFSETGKVATTWNSIGTLKIYASTVNGMFSETPTVKATLKFYNNPSSYTDSSNGMGIFSYAATTEDSLVTVNYKSSVTSIDDMIATQPEGAHVVKGSLFS